MAGPDDKRTDGAPPSHIHIEKKKPNWLAWIALILGILALLLALSRCHRTDTTAVDTTTVETNTVTISNETAAETPAPGSAVIAKTPNAGSSTVLASTSGLGDYLAGSEPAPRSFTFEKLNFDTAKSAIRSQDAAEIASVASVLQRYPGTQIKIAGYADARGTDAANVALGKARADSVKAALVAKGIDASRIDTATGGESDPVDSNATASGQAENRRTELVVIKR